jgi:hypothetical protein
MTAFIARPPRLCVLCAPGSPWNSRWRSCIENTRVACAAPWSSYCTARDCCCYFLFLQEQIKDNIIISLGRCVLRPLHLESLGTPVLLVRRQALASGVSGHPSTSSQASSRVGQRICRRGTEVFLVYQDSVAESDPFQPPGGESLNLPPVVKVLIIFKSGIQIGDANTESNFYDGQRGREYDGRRGW